MKPAPFKFVAASSLDEALTHLAHYADEARVIAGGQSLVPLLALRMARPQVIVDINRIDELSRVERDRDSITLGAMLRQQQLVDASVTPGRLSLLRQAVRHLGHPATRSRGTVGGSLAHADPAAELPACMLALDATFRLRSAAGSRDVAAAEFFLSALETTLEPNELLQHVRIPMPEDGNAIATSFHEVSRRLGDFALVAIACVMQLRDQRIARVRVAAAGVEQRPIRLNAVEQQLTDAVVSTEALAQAARLAAHEVDPITDLHASGAYRRQLLEVLTARALKHAAQAASKEDS